MYDPGTVPYSDCRIDIVGIMGSVVSEDSFTQSDYNEIMIMLKNMDSE